MTSDAKLEIEAKKHLNKLTDNKGRPPTAVAKKIRKLKAEQKLAAENAAAKVVDLSPDAFDPNKVEDFMIEYLRNGMNTTKAVLAIHPTLKVRTASYRGQQYFREAQKLGMVRLILEKKGIGLEQMLDEAYQKMKQSKDPHFWDRLMKLGGWGDFLPDKGNKNQPQVVNIIGSIKKDVDEFGFAEEGEVVE